MSLWAFDELIVKMLRAAGYNERADAVARSASEDGGASRPTRYEAPDDDGPSTAPLQQPGAAIADTDAESAHATHAASAAPSHGAAGSDTAGAEQSATERVAASPGEPAAPAAEAMHAGDIPNGSGHAGTSHGETSDAPTQSRGSATRSTPGYMYEAMPEAARSELAIDTSDPLSGLYSSRLRDSLAREAFGSASGVAQDSAIVAQADSFASRFQARAQRFGPDAVPVDISSAAQASRIAALNGEIPPFARGNPALDPAMMRTPDQTTKREPVSAPRKMRSQSPIESPARSPSQSPGESPGSRAYER
ncbi:Uncharacterised protein [Burkholderia pseudomallei]|nr:Uncharacterised protein [Burkholderia pseudomallei]CAJ3373728.1 Uncharacterised protein [Burkholderia pseudomallei]CAJ8955487.1 Uncharacterised protein [Burkholderia pseudomallei]